MKSKDFADLAAEVAELLDNSGAAPAANAWQMFSGVFNLKPTAKVSEICKSLSSVSPDLPPVSNNLPRVKLIVQSIPALDRLFTKIGKNAISNDLRSIANAIAPFGEMGVSDFSALVSERLTQSTAKRKPSTNLELVERYVASLEQTYRDESAFKLAYAALTADKSVKAPEAKEIAKRFAGAGGKNKVESLKSIWRRHEIILIDRAKDAATAGRTAA
jgi:hypothetical protein